MSEFRFSCKRKKLIRALVKMGLALKEGRKHTKVECVHNGKKTTVPRHKEIKKEIVESICNFILDKDFEKEKLAELLK